MRSAEQEPPSQPSDYHSFYYRPIVPLVLAYMAGIAMGRNAALSPAALAFTWGLTAAAFLFAGYRMLRGKSARYSPLVLFLALGVISIAPWQTPFFPPGNAAAFLNGGYLNISGNIVNAPATAAYRTKCVLRDLKVSSKTDEPQYLDGKLRATFYGSCPELTAGDRVTVHSKIRNFKNFNNPGGFDYRQFMADQNVWGALYARGSQVQLETAPVSGKFKDSINRFRNRFDEAVHQKGNENSAAVLSALTVGKRDGISPGLREAFNRAGVSHLLAISGLHVGIIAAFAFLVLKWLLSWSDFLLRRGWVSKYAAVLTIFPVIIYAMISGMSPSTQRAMVMVLVFLFTFLFERDYNAPNTLATAALAILIVSPTGLFSISFQLSFAAVSAIFFGLHLTGRTPVSESTGSRISRKLISFILVSVFAIIGTTPLAMHYFNQVSVLGVISNLILVPWIGFVIVPTGLTAAALFPFCPGLSGKCIAIADAMLKPAIEAVFRISDLPFGALKTATPSVIELGCAYALIIGVCLVLDPRYRHHRKTLACLLALTVTIATIDAAYWLKRRLFNDELRVTVLDVGQGMSALLELPDGKTMLIDGGGFSDNSHFDVGALILAPYLWRNKIQTVDTIVLSHPDSDHLNGLLYILEHFDVKEVISTGERSESSAYAEFTRLIEHRRIRHIALDKVDYRRRINGVSFAFFHPEAQPGPTHLAFADVNDRSLVVQAKYNEFAMLFPGDIEAPAEAALVSRVGSMLASDILIAAHHGSKSSSTGALLEAVNPKTIIIPVRESRFGLPSKSVLERYRERGCRVYRTDRDGAVKITVDEEGARIRPTINNAVE